MRADREWNEGALADLRHRRGGELDAEVRAPRDHVGNGFGRALERNVLRLEARSRAQTFGTEVGCRTDARGRVIERPGPGLAAGDQVTQRLVAFGRRADDHQRLLPE